MEKSKSNIDRGGRGVGRKYLSATISMIHYVLKNALDVVETRRVKILRCLTEEKKRVDYYKLREITRSDLSTIKNDIEYINRNFGHICSIKEEEDKQLKLQIYNGDSKSLMLAFYYSTKSIQIIDFILQNECTIIKLSNELYIAQSTCYKYLKRVKNFLKDYNLTLTNKNLRILGDEIEIRKLMFLIEFLKNSKDINGSLVDELIEDIRFFGIKYSPGLKRELTMVLNIAIKRSLQKKNVQIDNEMMKKIREDYVYDGLYKPLREFFIKKKINLPEDELDYLIIFLLSNIDILVGEDEIEEIKKIKENSLLIYNATTELIEAFEDNLSISLKNDQMFFLNLLKLLKSRYTNMRFIPTGYFFVDLNEKKDKDSIILKHIKKKELKIINDTFYNWAEKYELQYIEPKDIEKCWILIESCMMRKNKRKYKVFLCISKGAEWEYYSETILKKTFGDNIQIYFHSDINRSGLRGEKFDFIISDVRMDFNLNANKVIIIDDIFNVLSVIEKIKILN